MNHTERSDAIDIIIRTEAAKYQSKPINQSQYDAIMETIGALPGVDAIDFMKADRQLHYLVASSMLDRDADPEFRKKHKIPPFDVTTLPYAIPLPKCDRHWERGLISSEEFLTMDIPPRKSLLVDTETNATVFYAASINQIFAFRGIGKSVIGNALTMALISGADWLHFRAPKPCRVLLVDAELPAALLQDRLREFASASKNLQLLSPELADLPNLGTKIGQVEFLAMISRFDPEVIVLDTLTRCFRFDTNDADSWLAVNDFLIELRSRGYCVVLIHHAGKNMTQRGRTDGDDNLDVSIKLEAPYGWVPGDGLAFKWIYEKVRHGGHLKEFEAQYTEARVWQTREDPRVKEVLEMVAAGKSCRAIAAALDMSKSAVSRITRHAREQDYEAIQKRGGKLGKTARGHLGKTGMSQVSQPTGTVDSGSSGTTRKKRKSRKPA